MITTLFQLSEHRIILVFTRFHIRRTDKLKNEAHYIHIKEYFRIAEIYFKAFRKVNKIEKLDNATIFIMTDDTSVLTEAELR